MLRYIIIQSAINNDLAILLAICLANSYKLIQSTLKQITDQGNVFEVVMTPAN